LGIIRRYTGFRVTTGYRMEVASTSTAGRVSDSHAFDLSGSYEDGNSGSGKADRALSRKNEALTGSDDLILSSYNTPAGVQGMVRVLVFCLQNKGTVNLAVGPASTNGWDVVFPSARTVLPGEVVFFAALALGHAVTLGSKDRLRVNCPSGTGSYELEILGASA
jgi:hypothetical protein